MSSPRTSMHATALAAAILAAAPVGAQQPADSSSSPAVTLSGEVRTRAEYVRPEAGTGADGFTAVRSRLGVRADVARGARVVLQLQDARTLGMTNAPSDAFTLYQGYVELAAPWRDVSLTLRAGRQEIALGNERLVGAVGWSNVGRSFDGARVLLAPRGATPGAEPWMATAFGAIVEERGRRFGPSTPAGRARGSGPDHAVAGLFATRALGAGARLEGTLLHDANARFRSWEDARRTTLDARLVAPRVLGVSAQLEGAVQVGRQRWIAPEGADAPSRRQDVRAWLLGARIGTPVSPARRASAAVGLDVLSGDADPTDGSYGAFSTLFATNHPFYGLMDVIGDPAAATKERGLVDALATGSLVLSPAVILKGELHHLSLARGAERPLGWEADLVLPVRVSANLGLEAGYAAFRASRGAAAVGLGERGDVRQWTYLQVRAGF